MIIVNKASMSGVIELLTDHELIDITTRRNLVFFAKYNQENCFLSLCELAGYRVDKNPTCYSVHMSMEEFLMEPPKTNKCKSIW